jgi:phosphoribosylformimino-5-aminoimidazole carboxamide ribotide isomerase
VSFQILPAIDLMGGAVVRLQQGDAKRKTVYPVSPAEMAAQYEAAGARRIHVVDLDGAFEGDPKNMAAIRAIRGATSAKIEVGGGVRDRATVQALVDAGIDHTVIGTRALEDPKFLAEMVREFGDRIIVGADARSGYLATRGWTSDTLLETVPFLTRLVAETGVQTVIFTDIARDGMFTSPNLDALGEVLAIPGLKVIASGGVGGVEDVRALRSLNNENLLGVIVGKALYDGRVSLAEAIRVASGPAGIP